ASPIPSTLGAVSTSINGPQPFQEDLLMTGAQTRASGPYPFTENMKTKVDRSGGSMEIRSTWITSSHGKKANRLTSLALTLTVGVLLLAVPAFCAQKAATQSTKATAGPAASIGVWTAPLNV